ncbi:hypothetical protein AB0872_20995 [Microbacterium sp. NPDC047426]|jgi:hypothetical protein
MDAARANVALIGPALVGLGLFSAVVLPGDGLSLARFGLAAAVFIATCWGGAWALSRALRR